jgi:benzylsuccinate CoA-transferase BbsF subunit
MGEGPLSGVRVADFTWIGAGSYTTKLLSDFGADVIKVETSTRLDSLRITAPFKDGRRGVNRSGYFADRNTSKRSIQLDLKHPASAGIARALIARSDVVANNFSPGTMEKFALGYEEAAKLRPDIIYLSMSMQGQKGPDRSYVGFGLTIGALTGLHFLSGQTDRPPAGTGTNYPDHVPNPCHAAFALLAALLHRARTGEGQFIDLAQTEPTIGLIAPAVIDWTVNGHAQMRSGNADSQAAPHGVYPCRGQDRWIAIGVHTDAQWAGLVHVLGAPPDETGWANAAGRRADLARLDRWIAACTRDRDARALMDALQADAVPAGMVQNARDLIEDDPQLAHRRHWLRLDHPEMGRTLYNAPPIRLSETPASLHRPAPLLGEHTEEVCCDLLGMDGETFRRLREDGVFT